MLLFNSYYKFLKYSIKKKSFKQEQIHMTDLTVNDHHVHVYCKPTFICKDYIMQFTEDKLDHSNYYSQWKCRLSGQ